MEVSEAEGKLEAAKATLEKLESHQKAVLGYMTELELSLGSWESQESSGSVATDAAFVSRLLAELPRQECELKEAEAAVEAWKGSAHSGEVLAGRVGTLRRRWDALARRLAKWDECLKNMGKDAEGLHLEYEVLYGELAAWVDEASGRVGKLLAEAPPPSEAAAAGLHAELSEARGKVEGLRDKALELSGRGEEWEAKVQPSLTALNTRWEALLQDVKELQKISHHLPSLSPTVLTSPQGLPEPKDPPSPKASAAIPPIIVTAPTLADRSKLRRTDTTTVAAGTPPPSPTTEAKYGRAPSELELSMESVKAELGALEDSRADPPDSVADWAEAVAGARGRLAELRPRLDAILAEGQALADSGPMELHTQFTLDQIDVLHTALEGAQDELEDEEEAVAAAADAYANFRKRIAHLSAWIAEQKPPFLQVHPAFLFPSS